MRNHLVQRLSALDQEIGETNTELSILKDRLASERATLEEYRLRMLVAETPIADRDLHLALAACARIEAEISPLEARLDELHAERHGLTGEALPTRS